MRKSQAASAWSRVILSQLGRESPISINRQPLPICSSRAITAAAASGIPHFHVPNSQFRLGFHFPGNHRFYSSARTIQELLADVEREKHKEREEKKRAGLDTSYIDAEDQEDYMGVGALIEKLEKEKLKDSGGDLNMYEEPTDSDSDDDERFTPDAIKQKAELFEKKFKRHEDLLKNFTDAGNLISSSPEFPAHSSTSGLEKLIQIVSCCPCISLP